MSFILGRKLNMTQVFNEDGTRISVTALKVGPCRVVQVKTSEKDGYKAVQLGYGATRKISKSLAGHQKDQKFRYLKEFRASSDQEMKVGDEITVSAFTPGSFVNVSGVMKGRGFAGVMKRHGFHGFPASHGHDHPRQPGAIGGRYPQHTIKGMRMAGHMGAKQVTVKNLEVVDIDPEQNIMWVKGAIPGSRNELVKVITSDKPAAEPRKLVMAVKPESEPEEQPKTSQDAREAGDGNEAEAPKVEAQEAVKPEEQDETGKEDKPNT